MWKRSGPEAGLASLGQKLEFECFDGLNGAQESETMHRNQSKQLEIVDQSFYKVCQDNWF